MLEVADVCPSCGQVHTDRQFGFKHRSPRECPLVVMGSFPVVTLPNPPAEPPIRVPASRRIRDAEEPFVTFPVLSDSRSHTRPDPDRFRGRAMSIPWLPPPDLGEVL